MDIRTAGLVVGIGLATLKIVSACVVYLRTQTLGGAGVSLVGGGVVLMAVSVWSATLLQVAEHDAARIGDVQRDVVQLDEASKAVSQQLLGVAEAQALSLRRTEALAQVVERTALAQVIESAAPAAASEVRRLGGALEQVPRVDLGVLERLSRGSPLSSRRALASRPSTLRPSAPRPSAKASE